MTANSLSSVRRSLTVMLVTLVAALHSVASHALVEIDITDPQNGSTLAAGAVLDDVTGFIYLKTEFTTGLTFDDIVAGAGGWVNDGWAIANTEETCALIENAGPVTCPGQSAGTPPDFDTSEIVDLLGGGDRIFAVFDDADLGSSPLVVGAIDIGAGSAPMATVSLDFTSPSVVFGGPDGSVLLTRLPEPATGLGLFVGTLTVAALRRASPRGACRRG